MNEQVIENPKIRVTNAFLNWVKNAVDSGIPVFVQTGNKEELSPPLKNISTGFRLLGLTEVEMRALAKSGEAAAKLDRALREQADAQKVQQLKSEYEQLWGEFSKNRQELANKYGLTSDQMLQIFKELTKS